MREIKFRAYADGEMFNNVGVVGNIIVLEYDSCEDDYGVDLELNYYGLNDDSIKLMQFTGLHDKNGKEIYEGDILHLDAHQDLYVEYYKEARFVVKSTNKVQRINWYPFFIHEVVDMGYNVIGNIYENPELLKEEVK